MATVDSPIGAVLKVERPSAADLDADPDLDRWVEDRWAPHSFEAPQGVGTRSFPTDDGSFHARTITAAAA